MNSSIQGSDTKTLIAVWLLNAFGTLNNWELVHHFLQDLSFVGAILVSINVLTGGAIVNAFKSYREYLRNKKKNKEIE